MKQGGVQFVIMIYLDENTDDKKKLEKYVLNLAFFENAISI